MSYDAPQQITYSWNGITVSSTDTTKYIRGPKGKRGRLIDAIVSVTTTTAGATTTPIVKAGVSGTLDKFFAMDVGALTAPNVKVASAQTTEAAGKPKKTAAGQEIFMDADTTVIVTFVAATGAGAAGVLDMHMLTEWF